MNYMTLEAPFVNPSNFHSPISYTQIMDNNNSETKIQNIWSKHNFETCANPTQDTSKTWNVDQAEVKQEVEEEKPVKETEETSPSHHARRPMNAFLIFCKKHRPIVRDRFPNLENRGVTRILGEWWALLDEGDKAPYTNLAKEYKDAFLTANPDFKWYKLPAPPLRTLAVRPTYQKLNSPVLSPTHPQLNESEFTPGKLADESQLGSLTSLMNNNYTVHKTQSNENNNNVERDEESKPFKKRNFQNEELNNQNDFEDDSSKEVRKSGRQCKGKRYEKFMVEGRLLGNKRETKFHHTEAEMPNSEMETPNLETTIKRLAQRTNMRIMENDRQDPQPNNNETSFDLNERITNLPSLSYDVFHQRKKESKKRKNRIRHESETKTKIVKLEMKNEEPLIGSKKRKNKQSITHLKDESSFKNDLLALATLAEIAANTEKIISQ